MRAETRDRVWYIMLLAVVIALCLAGCTTPAPPGPLPPPLPDDLEDRWGVGWIDPQGWVHEPRGYWYGSNECWQITTRTNQLREADGFWYFPQREP